VEVYSAYCTPTADGSGPCPLVSALAVAKRRPVAVATADAAEPQHADGDKLATFRCTVR
jgi:hypothetical protein